MKKVIRLLHETTSENPKSQMHIPQPKKGIYVLNIIIHNILEKEKMMENYPKGTPKTLMPLVRVQKHDGGDNHESNPKGD
jgi:hypothetical protein